MGFEKRVPSEFGLILPRETDTYWIKQGGGMSPKQYQLEGVYIPLGTLTHFMGYPDWAPTGPDFEEKLQEIDLHNVPEDDIPKHILERGKFMDKEEYFYWISESEFYGHVELWDDLYRFTYGLFDLLESDPRNRWEDSDQLWMAIDKHFSFTYSEINRREYRDIYAREGLDEYPRPQSAIRPIQITGSKEGSNGQLLASWAEDIKGEVVFLMCPNAD